MKWKLKIEDAESDGPFDVWTLAASSVVFVEIATGLNKADLLKGTFVDLPSDITAIKLINRSECCAFEQIFYVSYTKPRPTNTPTPSFSPSPTPTPSPSPSATSTPTPTPTPTPTSSVPVIESTARPSYINKIAYTVDVNTHEFTLWVNSTEDVAVRIAAASGVQPSGLSTDGLTWDNNTFLPGTTQYAAPDYTKLYRFNPLVLGQGGIIPQRRYTFFIRINSVPNQVYKFDLDIPASSTNSGPVLIVSTTPIITPSLSASPIPTPTPSATVQPTPTPTPTPDNANLRMIWMNATGYGLDTNQANGIHPDWIPRLNGFLNMTHNGNNFSGINGFRMCIKWSDYEPTEGNYNDTALRAAINWCKDRGLKFAVCFWALRNDGDGFFTDANKATGSNGQIFKVENNKHTLSLYSTTGRAKLKATVKHLAQVLREFPTHTDYISLGYGDTEEFFMPIIRNVALTGYSSVDIAAWNAYATAHGQNGAAAPVSPNISNAFTTGDYWNSTAVTRLWYEFMTEGLAGIHAAFRDGVHEGGGKACGFFADAGGAQSSWYGHYRINQIFAGCDNVYTSEGGTVYELGTKLMATDLIKGTFPSAKPSIEFDPQDIAANPADGNAYGININPTLLLQYSKSFFERGGNYVHLATAFSSGENGYVNNIAQCAPALWELQQTVIPQGSTLNPMPQGTTINFALSSFSGDAGYRSLWNNQSGGLSKQIKINLT